MSSLKIPAAIQQGFINPPEDLNQLKLIDRHAIEALAADINQLTPADLAGRKLVIMLATGGTLAMRVEQGIRRPAFSHSDLLDMVGGSGKRDFLTRGISVYSLDSSQMNYSHVRELAIVLTYLWHKVKVPFLGFLITHGTDTMSYGAAAMSLMMGQGLPFSIIYTGSQAPIDQPLSDAASNIYHALYTLEALHARNMAEVLIVMGERAMLATSAEKVDDSAVNAFAAPRHFYVANFSRPQHPVLLAPWLNPRRQMPFKPTIWHGDWSHTLVIKSTLGLDPTMLEAQINLPQVQAIILYSYGAGTIHDGVLQTVASGAKARQIPVFVVNPVNADYHVEYESSARAIELGVVPLNLTLSSALAKIEIALRLHPGNPEELARFMVVNYVGEVPNQASRLSPSVAK